MGVAASYIAKLLEKYRWIAWIGLTIVLYVALKMVWDGGWDVAEKLGWLLPPGLRLRRGDDARAALGIAEPTGLYFGGVICGQPGPDPGMRHGKRAAR